MAWRLARSLEVLREQINTLAPKRSKLADGTIGDEKHSSRTSDHNPNPQGVVCALDITHDPAKGVDSELIADALRASHDHRIKYIISNRKIASSTTHPWQWRPYTGKNPHNHHFHISVGRDYDLKTPWEFVLGKINPGTSPKPSEPSKPVPPVLRKGSKGQHVEALQILLNKHGLSVVEDGDFGNDTKEAVMVFQSKMGLVADGTVGRYTWDALKEKPK